MLDMISRREYFSVAMMARAGWCCQGGREVRIYERLAEEKLGAKGVDENFISGGYVAPKSKRCTSSSLTG